MSNNLGLERVERNENVPRCWKNCGYYDDFLDGKRVVFAELCYDCPLKDFQEIFSRLIPEVDKGFVFEKDEEAQYMGEVSPCTFCNFKAMEKRLEPCNSCNSHMRRNMLARGQIRLEIRDSEEDVFQRVSKEEAEKELLNRYRQVRQGVSAFYPEQVGLTEDDLFSDDEDPSEGSASVPSEVELECAFENGVKDDMLI